MRTRLNALGNALGDSLASASTSGSAQGVGPYSDVNYQNGSDIESDNNTIARESDQQMLADNRTALNAANVAADPSYYSSPTPEQSQAMFRQSEHDYRQATDTGATSMTYRADDKGLFGAALRAAGGDRQLALAVLGTWRDQGGFDTNRNGSPIVREGQSLPWVDTGSMSADDLAQSAQRGAQVLTSNSVTTLANAQRDSANESLREQNRFSAMSEVILTSPAAGPSEAFALAQSKGFAAYWQTQRASDSSLPAMVSRGDWAQYAPDTANMRPDSTSGQFTTITLHHTGSEETAQEVETLQRGHESSAHKLGRAISSGGRPQEYNFADVGYNFMIAPDGTIFEGRSLQYEAAHVSNAAVGNRNPGNVGIAFLGSYSSTPLSDAQVNSASALIGQLNNVYDIPSRNPNGQDYIYTHAQFDSARHSELAGAAAQVQALKQKIYGR